MKRILSMTTLAALCWTALVTIGSAQAKTGLRLNAPIEMQVVQRNDKNLGDVVISGVINEGVDVIEAKADLADGFKNGEAVGWTEVARGKAVVDGKFSGQLTLKAGGWYTITVRAMRGDKIIVEATVSKVGVGDVFVTAGQSNSANHGSPRQSAKDPRVVYFDGKKFVPAVDPIPGASGKGGAVWSILGDHIARSQQVPVCFRSASLHWTAVIHWLPDPRKEGKKGLYLYGNLVKCVREFPGNGVRAVLWHQGESDNKAKTSTEDYYERLKTVIDSLNKDAGYKIPWFVAEASFMKNQQPGQDEVVAKAQRLLWEKGVAKQGPNTNELLGRKYRSDGTHFNQAGLTAHGERWFKALAADYKWKK